MLINHLLQKRLSGPLAKPLGFKSKKHLDWVKDQPCVITGHPGPNDPHHVYSKKAHQNDYLCIPLRHELHQELHNIGKESFENKYKTDLDQLIIVTLIERLLK